jgi:hypothetical protein
MPLPQHITRHARDLSSRLTADAPLLARQWVPASPCGVAKG